MRIINEAFIKMRCYGFYQMARHLCRQGCCVRCKRAQRPVSRLGLSPIYRAPKTSEPHP
jgi:putative transposase